MSVWHVSIVRALRQSGLFVNVQLTHFQERQPDGAWIFSESTFRGDVEEEIQEVIEIVRQRTIGEE